MKNFLLAAALVVSLIFLPSFIIADPTVKSISYKIFGEQYAATPILDQSLAGHIYYIVSGHGGPDPGAMFNKDGHWLCEDEYAYDVSLRLARNLITHGALVYIITRDENDGIRDEVLLTPDKDETVWGGAAMPLNQKSRLMQRTDAINKLYEENKQKGYKVQRTIVTHVDSRYEHHKVDVFFYYNQNSIEGKTLAYTMYNALKRKYDEVQKDRGYNGEVNARGLWMLNKTKPSTVYIELGNISNSFDQKRLLLPNNRQAIANWLTLGIQNMGN